MPDLMRKKINWNREFFSGFVVFLIALPLSLGISLATGASSTAGLISAIIGGIIVGFFSGCPLQVSGPAAGLITIVSAAISEHGIENLGMIVFLAGGIQLLFGYFRIGQIFRAVAPAIIQGMLTGIGIVIFASQFHLMVDDSPHASTIQNLISIPESIIKGIMLPEGGETYHHLAAIVGSVTMLIIILFNFLPKKFKIIPSSLIAVIVAMLIANLNQMPINFIQVPKNIFSDINIITHAPDFSKLLDSSFLFAATVMAFVASAETLLTATAVDQMHTGKRTRYNKEIFAQGIGNMIAGILGVLPISGVIVRSATNVQTGAKTRYSTIFHGILILIFILIFPYALSYIPKASLAAILVYTGYKLINFKAMKTLFNFGFSELIIYFITVFGIIIYGLLEGILIGLIVSVAKLLYLTTHLEIKVKEKEDYVKVDLKGTANFINLPSLAEEFEEIPQKEVVKIHFDKLNYIDHACLDFLISWERQYENLGGRVYLELHTLSDRLSKFKDPIKEEKKKIKEENKTSEHS